MQALSHSDARTVTIAEASIGIPLVSFFLSFFLLLHLIFSFLSTHHTEARKKCDFFLRVFSLKWPESSFMNCDKLPDSSDPEVCVGFREHQLLVMKSQGKLILLLLLSLLIASSWLRLVKPLVSLFSHPLNQFSGSLFFASLFSSPFNTLCIFIRRITMSHEKIAVDFCFAMLF